MVTPPPAAPSYILLTLPPLSLAPVAGKEKFETEVAIHDLQMFHAPPPKEDSRHSQKAYIN